MGDQQERSASLACSGRRYVNGFICATLAYGANVRNGSKADFAS